MPFRFAVGVGLERLLAKGGQTTTECRKAVVVMDTGGRRGFSAYWSWGLRLVVLRGLALAEPVEGLIEPGGANPHAVESP